MLILDREAVTSFISPALFVCTCGEVEGRHEYGKDSMKIQSKTHPALYKQCFGYDNITDAMFQTNLWEVSAEAKVLMFVILSIREQESSMMWCKEPDQVAFSITGLGRIAGLDKDKAYAVLDELKAHGMIVGERSPFRIPRLGSYYGRSRPFRRIKVDEKTRDEVLSVGECARCGTTDDLSVDHIIPVSKGGGNEIENLQCLCRSCNSSKYNKIEVAE